MNIIINGKRAVLKKGSSFEYVSENRRFTDADAYTLAIELPLKGCPENLAIFGNINRKDVPKSSDLLSCELQASNFTKHGSIAITEITDIMVKVQFLEGRSVQNCATDFDTIYINELNIGYNTYIDQDGGEVPLSPTQWPLSKLANSLDQGQEWQALPWVNNYSGNIQNNISFATSSPNYDIGSFTVYLSFQCYLLALTKRIFNAVGYTCNLRRWEVSTARHLLCCNSLPAAWGIVNYARALPHWSLTDYIEQLELLLNGEFDIDHHQKTVNFNFCSDIANNAGTVQLTNIVNEYTATQEDESECDYKPATNVQFASCSHEMWPFYDCSWVVKRAKESLFTTYWLGYKEVQSYSQLVQEIPQKVNVTAESLESAFCRQEQRIYYVKDWDRYFTARRAAIRKVSDGQAGNDSPGTNPTFEITLTIQPVNLFAPYVYDEKAETKELKIVPAWLDDLGDMSKGFLLYLDCGELDNNDSRRVADLLERGEQKTSEFHDKIYVAYWKGEQVSNKYPHPYIDAYDINTDRTLTQNTLFQMQPGGRGSIGYFHERQIKRAYRYDIEFLSDTLPDVRALFYIHGKRYLCKKITATFTESGMSQLMKGEFYEVL